MVRPVGGLSERYTVDQIVAKLSNADLEVCKALTHSSAANAAGLMWTGGRARLDSMTNQGLITLVLF